MNNGEWTGWLLPVLLLVVCYFFLILPQKRQRREHAQLMNNLKDGDQVVTIGGIHGQIKSINDETIILEVDQKMHLTFEKNAIKNIRNVEVPVPVPDNKNEQEATK